MDKKKLPKAVASGIINIGGFTIDCAILENGKPVVTRNALLRLMGKTKRGGGRPTKEIAALKSEGMQIPIFVSANNLIPFIPNTLSTRASPLIFTPLRGGIAHGYDANIIPDICDTYSDARLNGKLLESQKAVAVTLELISRGLSRVGIDIMVREACGMQITEKGHFQKILNDYIEKALQPWVKRFPDSFFHRYCKMYNCKNVPQHIGHFINDYIYDQMPAGVLEELRQLNPVNKNGRRSHTHHQFLTSHKGIQELNAHVAVVNALMAVAKNKEHFIELFKQQKDKN